MKTSSIDASAPFLQAQCPSCQSKSRERQASWRAHMVLFWLRKSMAALTEPRRVDRRSSDLMLTTC